MGLRHIIAFLILAGACSCLTGQALEVRDILISGNKKTKTRIILRELDFAVGDSLLQLELTDRLLRNENNLLRTGLFTQADLNVAEWDTEARQIVITIEVYESWYIRPIPFFDLADRNFNVWWNDHNASLSRVNIGMDLHILNLTGVNDHLKIKGHVGYTHKLEVTYLTPFVNRKQTVGLEVSGGYSTNKEVSMFNEDNKESFFSQDDTVIFKRYNFLVGTTIRPNLYATHSIKLMYHNNWVDHSLATEVNPDFFLEGRNRQQFFGIEYSFDLDERDLKVFATEGWRTGVKVEKFGLGIYGDINALNVRPYVSKNTPLSPRFILGNELQGKVSLIREKQPTYNYQGLGRGDHYLRGYELYIVDGLDFVYLRNSLHFLAFRGHLSLRKLMPIKALREMPWRIYLSLNLDTGVVNDPYYFAKNDFTNRWLYGGGVGATLMVYNGFAFQFQYSWNHLGENGLFLHANKSI